MDAGVWCGGQCEEQLWTLEDGVQTSVTGVLQTAAPTWLQASVPRLHGEIINVSLKISAFTGL